MSGWILVVICTLLASCYADVAAADVHVDSMNASSGVIAEDGSLVAKIISCVLLFLFSLYFSLAPRGGGPSATAEKPSPNPFRSASITPISPKSLPASTLYKLVDGWHSLDLFNAFCGGVFIAVGLVHLLPAAVAQHIRSVPSSSFPLPYVMSVGGFLMILFLERVAFAARPTPKPSSHYQSVAPATTSSTSYPLSSNDRTTSEGQAGGANTTIDVGHTQPTIAAAPVTSTSNNNSNSNSSGSASGTTSPTYRSGGRASVSGTTSHVGSLRKRPGGIAGGNSFMLHSAAGSLRAQAAFSLAAEEGEDSAFFTPQNDADFLDTAGVNWEPDEQELKMAAQLAFTDDTNSTMTGDLKSPLLVDAPADTIGGMGGRRQTFSVVNGSLSNIPAHVHHTGGATLVSGSSAHPNGAARSSSCTPYLLFVFLSVHCFVEGVVIGLSETVRGVITLVIAVALHKWIEAALVGVQLIKSRAARRRVISLAVLYAFFTPLGLLVGILTDATISVGTQSWLNAIGVGSFIYVGATELVVDSFTSSGNLKLKFFAVLIGATSLTLSLIGTW